MKKKLVPQMGERFLFRIVFTESLHNNTTISTVCRSIWMRLSSSLYLLSGRRYYKKKDCVRKPVRGRRYTNGICEPFSSMLLIRISSNVFHFRTANDSQMEMELDGEEGGGGLVSGFQQVRI